MSQSKRSVLIFEDDIDLLIQWQSAFQVAKFDVLHACDVDQAIKLCQEHAFDVIVCDMFMVDEFGKVKEQGGISFLHRLTQFGDPKLATNYETVPRIAVTGCTDLIAMTLKQVTFGMGCTSFLRKPFTPQELVRDAIKAIKNKNLDSNH